MTISDAAKAHHDQLFGDRVSSLARTDPEFVAYFDNFAFDEILATQQIWTTRSTCAPACWCSWPPCWRPAGSPSSGYWQQPG